MRTRRAAVWPSALQLIFSLLGCLGSPALAADLPPPSPPVVAPVAAPSGWTFTFVPYGWLTAMDGTQTVRGRSAKVDAGFIDIVEKSDTLVALMGTFIARNGPASVYTDLVWSKVGLSGDTVRSRSAAPGIVGTLGAALGLDLEMAIVEAGASYEVARFGPLSFDVLGGARYWYQEADVSFSPRRDRRYRRLEPRARPCGRPLRLGRLARPGHRGAPALCGGARP